MPTRRAYLGSFLVLIALLSFYLQSGIIINAEPRQRRQTPKKSLELQPPNEVAMPPPPPFVRSCPSTYIYNATRLGSLADLRLRAFGSRLDDGYLYDSGQHDLGSLILARLLGSQRCQHVSDPAQAELFLVPLVFPPRRYPTAAEANKIWEFMPPPDEERLWAVCGRFVDPAHDWQAFLPHLNSKTARRHVLIPLAYFELAGFCMGADPGWEYALDRNRELFFHTLTRSHAHMLTRSHAHHAQCTMLPRTHSTASTFTFSSTNPSHSSPLASTHQFVPRRHPRQAPRAHASDLARGVDCQTRV